MEQTKERYELLLNDLTKGQVNGLEEAYHELKQASGQFSTEKVQQIIQEVEKNYELKLKNVPLNIENIE